MLEDDYRSALCASCKKHGKPSARHAPAVKPSRENVISLMDVLDAASPPSAAEISAAARLQARRSKRAGAALQS